MGDVKHDPKHPQVFTEMKIHGPIDPPPEQQGETLHVHGREKVTGTLTVEGEEIDFEDEPDIHLK